MDVTLLPGMMSVWGQTGAKHALLFPCCTRGSLLVLSFLSCLLWSFKTVAEYLKCWGKPSCFPGEEMSHPFAALGTSSFGSLSDYLCWKHPPLSPYILLKKIQAPIFGHCWKPKQALCVPLNAHRVGIGKRKILPSIPWNSDICLLFSDFHTMPFPYLFYWVCRVFIAFSI